MSRAEVSVGGKCLGKIGAGFAVLLGVARDDTEADADFIADRILGVRVFADTAKSRANGLVAHANCADHVIAVCTIRRFLEAHSDKTVDCRSISCLHDLLWAV